ncbi:MAG: nicotinate (nicotinamide) nucleotide adenylyltransferase [Ferruginibacter sp.]
MKIGLYFGSFNPVHTGHLIIASHMADHTDLDEVWFVVSPQNPFKNPTALLNEQHRYSLVRIALEGEKKLNASNIEFGLPKPSYTVDTLIYLSEKYPGKTFSLILGSDSFQNFSNWKNYNYINNNYNIYIYLRPSFPIRGEQPKNVTVVQAPLLEISATAIRDNIRNGRSIRYLVTDAVKEEIEKNNYYGSVLENPTQQHAE